MSTLTNAFRINGVIDTNRNVIQNLNDICTACASWLSYDINTGLWTVTINQPGSSVSSFNNSNIIGGINVSGRGIDEMYNSVSIEFPHQDLRDQRDYIDLTIDPSLRYPNELDNRLNMSTDLVNDPVQAQYLAAVELKQSRVNRTVQFVTDYTKLGLQAGEIIDITTDAYSWTNKLFRITNIEELDTELGAIQLSITALEYDADVYDSSGLIREERNKRTGIIPKSANTELTLNDQVGNSWDISQGLPTLLSLLAGSNLLDDFFRSISDSALSGYQLNFPGLALPGYSTVVITQDIFSVEATLNAYSGDAGGGTGFNGDLNTGIILTFVLPQPATTLIIFLESILASYTIYPRISGSYVSRSGFLAYVPCSYSLNFSDGGPVQNLYATTCDWQTQNAVMALSNAPAGAYAIKINPLVTYDLNNDTDFFVYHSNYNVQTNSNGGGVTATAVAFSI